MKEFRTMKYHFKATNNEKKLLKFLCRISKNVYNCALYDLRKQYFETKSICTYFELNKIVSKNINYHILNTYQSLCTIRLAHSNMEKYIKYHNEDGTLNDLGNKFSLTKDPAAFPKYKKKKALMPLVTDQVRPIWYNKKKANLQSLLPKGIYSSKRIRNLENKRKNQVEDYLNKAVSTLMRICVQLEIDEIIIGYNKGFKIYGIKNNELKGKDKRKTNQNFIQIPISRFKDKIKLKASELGIYVRIINESYTSKSSFYDNDSIKKDMYSDIRIKRGLYQRKDKKIVNADINAALNIYKKYVIKLYFHK